MSDNLLIDVQFADDLADTVSKSLPTQDTISQWLKLAYSLANDSLALEQQKSNDLLPELSIRIVSIEESQSLNAQYRGKDEPTNVLSFESDLPDFVPSAFLGDLVICAQIVANEALEQQKTLEHHWAHMCIHGMLHLMGLDHIQDADAHEMESLEITILAKLGIDDPYQIS
ncbi:probable rRNA maturation factor [Glaciecola punicea ACAM 611]|jgi:probable rRNA maturation factor|uniref:Endoribonuclease YbeY n=1 Tax=Glaciecola punicea ACAM 611 TaxID=1121923 RepID=H5T8W4_9ALTE|nr:rRNA maturation RNase YbeY [Glaciecola punicea]OFA31634.1 rRNA maturation RNase YbeY [Glaciecola punicea]GAB54741.1 probable rRNA maturation factor [Glaciecola punicea ACAM 611]